MLYLASQLYPLLKWDGYPNALYKTSNVVLQALGMGHDGFLNAVCVKQLYKYNRTAFDTAVKSGIFFEYQTHVFTLSKAGRYYSVWSFNLDTQETRSHVLSYTTLKSLTAHGAHRDITDVLNGLLKVLA